MEFRPLASRPRGGKEQFWDPSNAILAYHLNDIKAIRVLQQGSGSSSSVEADEADDGFRLVVTGVIEKRVLDWVSQARAHHHQAHHQHPQI